MEISQTFLLGLVQGLTEFLPISSSGHLVFVPRLFGFTNPGVAFDLLLHFATLFALIIFFWKDLWKIIISFFKALFSFIKSGSLSAFSGNISAKTAWFIILGSIPTAIIGFSGEAIFEKMFDSVATVGLFLLITGILLYLAEIIPRRYKQCEQMRWFDAILVGMGQGLAIAPGLSRSATTISTALFCGLEKSFAARFSFLLAIPAILGATIFKTKDIFSLASKEVFFWPFLVGFIAALISGYLAIKYFLIFIQKFSLKWFAYYCFVVGLLLLIYL